MQNTLGMAAHVAGAPNVIELEFALGEEFGFEIPDADAEKITTVGEAVNYIRAVG
jgi:acyl carrier protein